jgi:hypothetical protein
MSSTQNETAQVDRETVTNDFKVALQGTLPDAHVEQQAQRLAAAATSFSANGSVVSLVFYLQFQVSVTSPGGKTFNGKAGGLSSPGGGALFGTIYTDDINRLYSDTASFAFTATPVYLAIYFFDGNSNALGSFQAGAVSIVTGTGGGTGSWS